LLLLQHQVLGSCAEPDALCKPSLHGEDLVLAPKLCSVVSAMSCALHLLMFCFSYLCNTTIPKRRETLSLFPHGTREITGPRYPLTPWNDFAPRNTGRTCDRLFLGTHRCLELAYPISFWRALKFLGGKRRGTLRPFPSRPSAPVSQLNADTSLSSASLSQHWYSLLSCPSVSGYYVWLAPYACTSPTHSKRRKMQHAVP